MFCPNCGNDINENDDFCGKCGKKISEEVQINEDLEKAVDVNDSTKIFFNIKKLTIFLVLIFVVFVLFKLFVGGNTDIEGAWQSEDGDRSIVFYDNNTCRIGNSTTGIYTISRDKVLLMETYQTWNGSEDIRLEYDKNLSKENGMDYWYVSGNTLYLMGTVYHRTK